MNFIVNKCCLNHNHKKNSSKPKLRNAEKSWFKKINFFIIYKKLTLLECFSNTCDVTSMFFKFVWRHINVFQKRVTSLQCFSNTCDITSRFFKHVWRHFNVFQIVFPSCDVTQKPFFSTSPLIYQNQHLFQFFYCSHWLQSNYNIQYLLY